MSLLPIQAQGEFGVGVPTTRPVSLLISQLIHKCVLVRGASVGAYELEMGGSSPAAYDSPDAIQHWSRGTEDASPPRAQFNSIKFN